MAASKNLSENSGSPGFLSAHKAGVKNHWTGSKIVVAGGRGFIGRALAAALSGFPDDRYSVLSINRGQTSPHSELTKEIGFEDEGLRERLKDARVFIYAAGKSKGSFDTLWQANVSALQHFIELLPPTVEQIIHFSTLNVLFPELSPYGETKLKGEQLWAASLFADRVTVLRPALIYGPGDRQNISRLIRLVDRFPLIPVPASGSLRPVFIQDLVDLVMGMIDRHINLGKAIVVSGIEQTNFRDLVRRIAHCMGCRRACIPLPDQLLTPISGAARLCGLKGLAQTIDGNRLERPWHDPAVWQQLSRPLTCLDEGLRQCVDDYKKNSIERKLPRW